MSRQDDQRPGEPGTLTSLVDEVFRGASADAAWVEGLSPGAALGRYDLIREVGRGGAAVVWEARDRELGRRVAVKVMRRAGSDAPAARLRAEAEIAARLSHPGVVTTLDVGRNEKGAWLVQEFLTGETLRQRLKGGPLPLRAALGIATKVAAALAYAHQHGVVHRDLSAANVFLCEDGQVKILDLGMAQAFGRRKVAGGTAAFMAPEQALGEPEDERVDVYALGVLLHTMLAGAPPFADDTPPERRLAPHLSTPELPGLGALVDRMLSPAPRDRPRDAAEALAEIDALQAALPATTTSTGTRPGAVRVRRRWPAWAKVAAGLALLAAVGLAGAGVARTVWPPARAEAPTIFAGNGMPATCTWQQTRWIDLDREPEGTVQRQSYIGGQGVQEVGGRKAWRIDADWGHIVIPIGDALQVDPFAVEAEFFIPESEEWLRGAQLAVFTNPTGGPKVGALEPGFFLYVSQAPGKAPQFSFGSAEGMRPSRNRYVGNTPGPVVGRWHKLRIEGSRKQRWYRGLLDGETLVVAHGDLEPDGRYVSLGVGYEYLRPQRVAWSNLRFFQGSDGCQ